MSAEPSLLLIHGLGATPGVWADLIGHLDAAGTPWPGRIITPTLPGHGASTWSGDYTLGAMAAAVSAQCEDGEDVVIVGHSLGGAVALALASGFFRPVVHSVIAVGIKVAWSDDDVAGMAKVAAKGIRWFDTAEQANDRFLLQAGLAGLVEADHPATADAIVAGTGADQGKWRVAQDPATFAQRALNTRGLVDAARCELVLGAGENDAMVSAADLQPYVDHPRIAPGCGHNVQVEDPAWFADLLG